MILILKNFSSGGGQPSQPITAQKCNEYPVTSVAGKTGAITLDISDVSNAVPTSRTINGFSLSSNITLTKSNIGLSNVPNVNCQNASNLIYGVIDSERLPSIQSYSYCCLCESGQVTVKFIVTLLGVEDPGDTFTTARKLADLIKTGKYAIFYPLTWKAIWTGYTNYGTIMGTEISNDDVRLLLYSGEPPIQLSLSDLKSISLYDLPFKRSWNCFKIK